MTMRGRLYCLLLLPVCTGITLADAPRTSLRPMPRPVETTADVPRVSPAARPGTSRQGSVCRDPDIKGVVVKPVASRIKGCRVAKPVQVTSVNGVRLNPPALINCEAAQALAAWVDSGLQPAFRNQVVQMNVADSYSCRPRNNVRGAKISEHGSGNAIDISSFVMANGKTVTVASNYDKRFKAAKQAACGTFRTTLGPGSDGFHEDHIHLDVARRRGNPYCH